MELRSMRIQITDLCLSKVSKKCSHSTEIEGFRSGKASGINGRRRRGSAGHTPLNVARSLSYIIYAVSYLKPASSASSCHSLKPRLRWWWQTILCESWHLKQLLDFKFFSFSPFVSPKMILKKSSEPESFPPFFFFLFFFFLLNEEMEDMPFVLTEVSVLFEGLFAFEWMPCFVFFFRDFPAVGAFRDGTSCLFLPGMIRKLRSMGKKT